MRISISIFIANTTYFRIFKVFTQKKHDGLVYLKENENVFVEPDIICVI